MTEFVNSTIFRTFRVPCLNHHAIMVYTAHSCVPYFIRISGLIYHRNKPIVSKVHGNGGGRAIVLRRGLSVTGYTACSIYGGKKARAGGFRLKSSNVQKCTTAPKQKLAFSPVSALSLGLFSTCLDMSFPMDPVSFICVPSSNVTEPWRQALKGIDELCELSASNMYHHQRISPICESRDFSSVIFWGRYQHYWVNIGLFNHHSRLFTSNAVPAMELCIVFHSASQNGFNSYF